MLINPKGSPLLHFPHYATFSENTNFFSKKKFLFPVLSSMKGPRSRVPVAALAMNFFEHLRKRRTLKGPLFQFFLGIVLIFFSKLHFPSEGPCIFLIFCNKLDFQQAQRVPPFTIFKTCAFWALDIASTLDVPILLVLLLTNEFSSLAKFLAFVQRLNLLVAL